MHFTRDILFWGIIDEGHQVIERTWMLLRHRERVR